MVDQSHDTKDTGLYRACYTKKVNKLQVEADSSRER